MADAGAGMGWWPRLVLWGAVIAAGAGYLLSVEQHRKDAAAPATGQSAALRVPAATAPVPAAPPKAVEAAPRQAIPPAVQVQAQGPVTPPAAPAAGPGTEASAPDAESVAAAPAAEAPIPERSGAAPQPAGGAATLPAGVSEVTAVEARAFAEAVTEAPSKGQTPAVSGQATAPVQAQTPGAPGAGAQTAASLERVRILAEYEALRRAAEGDLQPPGARARPGPQGELPYGGPRGFYGQGPYGAPGPGGRHAPAYPGW
jgi:hypothetical protein